MIFVVHLPSSFQIKEEDKDQESNHHVPHLTGKRLNTRKHQECQEASPFPGWKEQTRPYAKDKHETKVTKRRVVMVGTMGQFFLSLKRT